MVFKRPLLFLSLPSLALVLGLVWFRRKRNVHCDTGGDKINSIKNNNKTEKVTLNNYKHSKSLPIEKNNYIKTEFIDTKLGKSAPIDIIPNLRSPPFKADAIIDPEILNNKIRDSEYKILNSIEEQEDLSSVPQSPIDLPDSGDRRKFEFTSRTIRTDLEQPVIIKASMTAKISPKNSFAETKYTEECIEERDSANHSPMQDSPKAEQTMEYDVNNTSDNNNKIIENETVTRNPPVSSPPLSLCSVRSNDSGKGSSPPHSIGGIPPTIYDFLLPQNLVGQIIGRKGSYVNQIKSKTGANVIVKKHPETNKLKVCTVAGTEKEIEAALKMIRTKLPENQYPNLTMSRVFFSTQQSLPIPLDPTCLRLQLIEGINNDVIVSEVMSGGHVFFQQPLHPSYPSLNVLQNCMLQSYLLEVSPTLPDIREDVICVAPINGSWFRVQIISYNPETNSCLVKYLDYGGYTSVLGTELRQIRGDFMTIPFQAMECLLSNIKPIGGTEWMPEAGEVLKQLSRGIILQAQVAGYSSDGLAEVLLYACIAPDNVIFINQELVARGLAEWTEESQ